MFMPFAFLLLLATVPLAGGRLSRLADLRPSQMTSAAARTVTDRNTHRLAEGVVLAGESQQEFDDLLDSYLAYYVPTNDQEQTLVVEVAAARWRMHRAIRLETLLLQTEADRLLSEPENTLSPDAALATAFGNLTRRGGALNHLHREEARLRRLYEKVHAELLDIALVNQEMEREKQQHESDGQLEAEPPDTPNPPSKPRHPHPVPTPPFACNDNATGYAKLYAVTRDEMPPQHHPHRLPDSSTGNLLSC